MNHETIKNEIYTAIANAAFLKKYASKSKEEIIATIKLKDKISHFSWGIFYAYVRQLVIGEKYLPQLSEILPFEFLGLATEYLDDYFDKDNPDLENIDTNVFLFLYTDFLLNAIYFLGNKDVETSGFQFISNTLSGEWYDIHHQLHIESNEAFYINHVQQKSIDFFKFIGYHACLNTDKFYLWETIMETLAQICQISNDLQDIYNDTHGDIYNLTPTLPLIKFIESNPEENFKIILDFKENRLDYKTFLLAIEKSGAVEYCVALIEMYKKNLIQILDQEYNKEQIMPLLKYLHMESIYESI